MESELKPGDLIEWHVVNPRTQEIVPYDLDWILNITEIVVSGTRCWNKDVIPIVGLSVAVGVTGDYVSWLNGGRLYDAKRSALHGGFEFLTGSTPVIPRAMQKTSGSW